MDKRNFLLGFLGIGSGLVLLESVCRRKAPDSLWRPSNSIDQLTLLSKRSFAWIGFQFARFTDIYYLIKEYFPYEDIRRLGGAGCNLVISPFQALKGYHDYYTSGMTPLQYGLISSAVVVGMIGLGFRSYWSPSYGNTIYQIFHGLRRRMTGIW